MGMEVLNSTPVTYPREFALAEVLPAKELAESNNTEIKYKLAAVVEHVGLTPHSGHYVAYKRLFPESINTVNKKTSSDKWL